MCDLYMYFISVTLESRNKALFSTLLLSMSCHLCFISPTLLHGSVLGFFAFTRAHFTGLPCTDPVVASLTGSEMGRDGICHEFTSSHLS